MTPYAAQARVIRALLPDAVAAGLVVGSVERFQGAERRAIVVSTVRSLPAGSAKTDADASTGKDAEVEKDAEAEGKLGTERGAETELDVEAATDVEITTDVEDTTDADAETSTDAATGTDPVLDRRALGFVASRRRFNGTHHLAAQRAAQD